MPGGDPMTDDQILWEHTMMIVGGSETTRNAVGGGLYMLGQHKDQRAWLREHPEGVMNAVEEIVRWTTPFTTMSRIATRDVELGGQLIRQGDTVAMLYPAANREPGKFEDPHRFDVRRSFKNRILAFGHGRHLCLGAHLARMELKVMLEAMLRRAPEWEIGDISWARSNYLRGPHHMELAFGPGAR
jgi:cytochrome P450